jgi:hypothetical protein
MLPIKKKGPIVLLFFDKGIIESIYIDSQTDKQAEVLRSFLEDKFGGQFIKVSATLIHGEGKK